MLTKSTEEKSKYINMDVLATKQQLLSSTIPTNIHVFQYQYHTLACMREREREYMKQWFWIKIQLRLLRFTAAIYDNSLWFRASDLLFFEIIWTNIMYG